MPRFERSSGGRRDSGEGFSKSRSRGRFEDRPRGRGDSSRGSSRFSRGRRDVEMTKVTCDSCGVECEVPFKPSSSKPVYCNNCFEKKGKGSSGGASSKDIENINEKLDKIMKALKIE